MRLFAAVACALLACLSVAAPALADKRVALVIGNSAYQHMPKLKNPGRDAGEMAAALTRLGFHTTVIQDAGHQALNDGFKRFAQGAGGADLIFVYYSGHGTQLDGRNWLLPVDAKLDTREDVNDADLMALDRITSTLRDKSAVRIVVLDACRDNPMTNALNLKLAEAQGFRNAPLTRGLTRPLTTSGDLIVYATQAGAVAADGDGATSPFTASLLKHIETPDIDVRNMFFRVQTEVARVYRQTPEVSNSIIGEEFKLKVATASAGPAVVPSAPTMVAPVDPAAQAWGVIQNTTSLAVLEEFVRQFGTTIYGGLARARLEELRKSQVAAVAPPVKPAAPGSPCGSAAVTVSLARAPMPLSAAEECALKPKDTFRECDTCPEMVVAAAGSFMMGSPAYEKDRNDNEGPQHVVTFARPFAVGKFEVTVDQFAAFVKATGYKPDSGCWMAVAKNLYKERTDRSWRNPGFAQTGTHPATCLNWKDANAYAAWLASSTGKGYRLLSEAEWEYAARGRTVPGNAPKYHFGDDDSAMCQHENSADRTAKSKGAEVKTVFDNVFPCADGYGQTAPVGSFAANPFGLHDMLGNVSEYTADCFNNHYRGAPTDGSAWMGGDCRKHVRRGGDWGTGPWGVLRSAARSEVTDTRNTVQGLRVARALAP